MITDDQVAVVLPDGMSLKPKHVMNPPTKTGYFGWVDLVGDENTFKFDDIIGAVKARQDGRYYIYVRQLQQPVAITEEAWRRLLGRMGWTETSQIARA